MPSKLLVARDLTMGRPASVAQYRDVAALLASRVGREIIIDDRTLVAYVNAGRWVADCPHCAAGIMLDPDWPYAACLGAGCHCTFTEILWPDDRHDIEDALARRPLAHQHWGFVRGRTRNPIAAAESVPDLHRENEAHRDVIRRGA